MQKLKISMDKKFYLTSSGLICPFCKSNEIRILGESDYTGNTKRDNMVKCGNCGIVMYENDLEENEEDSDLESRAKI